MAHLKLYWKYILHNPMTTTPQIDSSIGTARKIIRASTNKAAFVRARFKTGNPNNSPDSTTAGTITALRLLLATYKKHHSLK
jgi:hypothetical protein